MSAAPEPIAIVGAGGHGRETLQALRATPHGGNFRGFFDDEQPARHLLERLQTAWLGTIADALEFDGCCLIGIGDGAVRRSLAPHVRPAPPIVHPMADVGPDVRLGPGSVVFAQATVTTCIDVGEHVHVGRGAAIGHDSRLEKFVSVMPLASISGGVRLRAHSFIGTGALIRQGVTVGQGATVGMGSVVLHDVPDRATVVGNPAYVLR